MNAAHPFVSDEVAPEKEKAASSSLWTNDTEWNYFVNVLFQAGSLGLRRITSS